MGHDQLMETLKNDETALGLWITDPEMVELAGYLNFDWFMIDHLMSSIGWDRTLELIRAGEAAGITPVIRVQSCPWLGYDHRIPVDVNRITGIGARHIMVSNSGVREIEESLQVAHGWHRKALHMFPNDPYDKREVMFEDMNVIPQPESEGALAEIEETMVLDGVDMLFLALGDASQEITDSRDPEWDDPALWEFIDELVALGEETDTIVGANPAFIDFTCETFTLDEIARRVGDLHDHGVQMIMIDGAHWLFQIAMRNFLADVNDRIE